MINNFKELGVSPDLVQLLKSRGITVPTEVQVETVPVARDGRDIIVQSQTGTGKTLAFLLPIMEKIKTQADVVQAVVVAPTRELAVQISKVAALLGNAIGVRSLAIYGGQDLERQKKKLGAHPHIIIGTPGRMLDHMRHKRLDLSHVNRVVLDEADEMLHMGFIEDVEQIVQVTASDRQLLLFSATMPDRIKALAGRYMHQPRHITIQSGNVTLDKIKQTIIDTTEETKMDKLCEIINQQQPYLAMIFCHTKQRVSGVAMELARRGYLVEELHGDLSQLQRTMVLKKFRSAELQLLVTTDIAARGLDIEGVTHVINYDIPHDTESYIHRIGRTGRAGQEGTAITFVNARQYALLRKIEAGIKNRIDKERSERSKLKKKLREIQREKALDEQKKEFEKTHKPLSKYANRKGSGHKGRNDRSRRQKQGKTAVKTNSSRRSGYGKRKK